MTWVLRDQIDSGNVGNLDAVRHGYKRRKVKIPADIDRLGLRRDIDRAICRLPRLRGHLSQAAAVRSGLTIFAARGYREIEDLID